MLQFLLIFYSFPFFPYLKGQGGNSKVDLETHDEDKDQGMGDLLGEEADSSLHLKGKHLMRVMSSMHLTSLTCVTLLMFVMAL